MFRRRSRSESVETDASDDAQTEDQAEVEDETPAAGPWDADDVVDDGIDRIDLGSLRVAPTEGTELRLQVDEQTGEVQSAMLAAEDGAIELRAFAAPRGGDLWSDVRPQIAADVAQHGGTATERDGRWGVELVCQMQVVMPDGTQAMQPSRIVGHQRCPLAPACHVPRPPRRSARRRTGLGGRRGRRRRPPGLARDAGRRPAPARPARRRTARQPALTYR